MMILSEVQRPHPAVRERDRAAWIRPAGVSPHPRPLFGSSVAYPGSSGKILRQSAFIDTTVHPAGPAASSAMSSRPTLLSRS
jgi:hypothetical protein